MAWNLNDFETALKRHSELEAKLATEPDILVIGNCVAVSTEKLKLGLMTELKSKINLFKLYLYYLLPLFKIKCKQYFIQMGHTE